MTVPACFARSWSLVCCCALAAALEAQTAGGLSFTDVSATAQITWIQQDGGFKMGAGGAFLDYDQDGWLDILCAGGVAPVGLFRNDGNGSFSDVSLSSGLAFGPATNEIMGCAVGDYDNDGYPDIYLVAVGENRLFHNNGDGSFSDLSQAAGVADAQWSSTAAFADFDGDGFADLFVGNYIAQPSFPFHTPTTNRLYHNNGDGSFSDLGLSSGIAGSGTALASLWLDDDDDGRPDLWVANDFGRWITPNRLWRNLGPGPAGSTLFADVAPGLGAAQALYCMGLTAGDIDRDGDFDVYMSNLGPNALLRNDGASGFVDIASAVGAAFGDDPTEPGSFATSWGVGFHDFDCDGWLDLYVSNGHIPAAPFLTNGLTTPSALFHHQGPSLSFSEVAASAGVADTGMGRGCAFGDYDNDGDVDILQFNIQGTPTLFRNDTAPAGAWIELSLRGRRSHRDAQGTRIVARVGGGVELLRSVNGNYSFESSSQKRVHFGLGAISRIDELEFRWPSGVQSHVYNIPVGANYPVVEPLLSAAPTFSSAPSTLADGQVLSVVFAFENGAPHTTAGEVFFSVSAAGYPFLVSPSRYVSVPAGGRETSSWQVLIPEGIVPANTTLPVEIVWTVVDTAGGVDQWRRVVVITP